MPDEYFAEYKTARENAFGAGSCHILSVRPEGGVLLEEYA